MPVLRCLLAFVLVSVVGADVNAEQDHDDENVAADVEKKAAELEIKKYDAEIREKEIRLEFLQRHLDRTKKELSALRHGRERKWFFLQRPGILDPQAPAGPREEKCRFQIADRSQPVTEGELDTATGKVLLLNGREWDEIKNPAVANEPFDYSPATKPMGRLPTR